jgi:uncharacterized protein (TIGR02231 family)
MTQIPKLIVAATCCAAFGSANAADSVIKRVTLYPGVAAVERVAMVAANASEVRLTCLPTTFDTNTIRVEADAGIRVGDVSVKTVPKALATRCNLGSNDAKIRDLEDQRAALDADVSANQAVLAYIKALNAPESGAARAASPVGTLDTTVESVRRAVSTTLVKQQKLARQKELLEQQIAALTADSEAGGPKAEEYREVSVRVAGGKGGELRLVYQVNGPGWTPAYRAALDSATGVVKMDRLAVVAQSSGEDWRGVQLRLSTAQPRNNATPSVPQPWEISILPPMPQPIQGFYDMARSVAASPAPMAPASKALRAPAPPPTFDASVFEGTYSTEFEVPVAVDLASNGQRVTLPLGTQTLTAKVFSRVVPNVSNEAFVMADVSRPEGVWPRGDMQLLRDNALVGKTVWNVGDEQSVTLAFGRDESLRVRVEPQKTQSATAGFIGNRQEREWHRGYTVENLRKTVANIEVLESTPVGTDADIKVEQSFSPQPTEKAWKDKRGVVAWTQTLAPGKSAKFTADYKVSYPKDARVGGL